MENSGITGGDQVKRIRNLFSEKRPEAVPTKVLMPKIRFRAVLGNRGKHDDPYPECHCRLFHEGKCKICPCSLSACEQKEGEHKCPHNKQLGFASCWGFSFCCQADCLSSAICREISIGRSRRMLSSFCRLGLASWPALSLRSS